MNDIPLYPKFILPNLFPRDEQHGSIRILVLLRDLGGYMADYHSAVQLFKHGDTLRTQHGIEAKSWSLIAVRDSAMAIYHISSLLPAMQFSDCQTLGKMVDHSKLKTARNLFDSLFPDANFVRHAISHAADRYRNSDKMLRNSNVGQYEKYGISVESGSHLMMSGTCVEGDKYLWTVEDKKGNAKVVVTECSDKVLAELAKVRNLVLEAFEPVYHQQEIIFQQKGAEIRALKRKRRQAD